MTKLDGIDDADLESASEPLDGRSARRERNVNAVLDVVLELFAEESLFPTIEQAATRSGLSLRSLYRYFADPGELLEATIQRSRERGYAVGVIHAIGEGPLAARIDEFVAVRLGLYETVGAMYRATLANAARLPRIADELARTRNDLTNQFKLQFAAELNAMDREDSDSALVAGDLLTQFDSVDFLIRHRGLSSANTKKMLAAALTKLLT